MLILRGKRPWIQLLKEPTAANPLEGEVKKLTADVDLYGVKAPPLAALAGLVRSSTIDSAG